MANIKTAISIEKPLFAEVEAMAEEMKISRSCLFALAAREFIRRYKSLKLLDDLNAVYNDSPDSGEKALQKRMRSKHRELVKDKW